MLLPTRCGLLWVNLRDSPSSVDRVLWLYEPNKYANLARFLPPGGGFVDVGSNLGEFTVWATRCGGPSTRVLAFEPDPNNRALLERNLRQHHIDSRVQLEAIAVSSSAGTVSLFQGAQSDTSTIAPNAVHELEHMRPRSVIDVSTETLDAVLERSRLPRVDVVKIDVEGAELEVLKGARELLRAEHPLALLIDLHWGVDLDQLTELLQDNGFSLRLEAAPDDIITSIPPKTLSIVALRRQG